MVLISYGTYINSCFEWESAQRSIISFVVWHTHTDTQTSDASYHFLSRRLAARLNWTSIWSAFTKDESLPLLLLWGASPSSNWHPLLFAVWLDFSLEHVKEMRRHVRRTRSSRRPHSWISFPAVRGGRVELRALHVAAGSAAAAGVELLLLLLQQGHIWHGEEKRKKLIHFLMNFIFQTVKRLLLPFFLLQSMEAMFEWEDDEEDKEDKVESSYCCSSLYWCEYTETLILLSVLSGVRAQGLHG